MTGIDPGSQQPCIHCRDCVRACPESLDPEALFLALANDDWPAVRNDRIDACSECNRCTQACPSHIPLLDWFRWGKSELHQRAQADAARTRFRARAARLARERTERAARQATAAVGASPAQPIATPVQTISKSEVLAAIARGLEKRKRRQHET